MKRAVKCVVSILLAIVCLFSYTLWDMAYALSIDLPYGDLEYIESEFKDTPSEVFQAEDGIRDCTL